MSFISEIKQKYQDKIKVEEKSCQRAYISIEKKFAKALLLELIFEKGGRLSTLSGVECREGIELLYHIALDKDGILITVKTLAERPGLSMETLADKTLSAEWVEREVHEMLGVNFIGHPNLERLLLPDDWPKGVYPYRKKTYESQKENDER
jgi:NADH-quinone oxidoreductase subunit C